MWRGSTGWDWYDSHDLNLSNRPVRTRMPGGVAGERPMKAAPYADCLPVFVLSVPAGSEDLR
jgi:hypothetical protein